MRRQYHRKSQSSEEFAINLTPMLDVVFIMLIFFIVTATFIREAGVDIFRPAAETSVVKPLVSVLVAVNHNGEIWIDNKRVAPDSLKANIERLHSENPRGGLVIQADQGARAERLLQVVEAARAAGIEDVTVSTEN